MEFAGKSEPELIKAAQDAVNNGASPAFVVKYLTERGATPDSAQRAVDEAIRVRAVKQRDEVDRAKNELQAARKSLMWRAIIFLTLGITIGIATGKLDMPVTSAAAGIFILLAGRSAFKAVTLED